MPFDFAVAETLARVAKHVYDLQAPVPEQIGEPEVVEVHEHDESITSYAGIYLWPNKTVVAYRGTMLTVSDWMRNFETALVPTPLGGRVHEGFYEEFGAIQDAIDEELRAEHRSGRPLYITGHSQGGAIAALATRHFEQLGIPVTATYTFAAPRPGNPAFRDRVCSPIHRVEFGHDIVPHVSPGFPGIDITAMLNSWSAKFALWFASPPVKRLADMIRNSSDYVSVGHLTYAPSGGKISTMIDPSAEQSLYITRLAELIWARLDLGEHHLMDNYIKAMASGVTAGRIPARRAA